MTLKTAWSSFNSHKKKENEKNCSLSVDDVVYVKFYETLSKWRRRRRGMVVGVQL